MPDVLAERKCGTGYHQRIPAEDDSKECGVVVEDYRHDQKTDKSDDEKAEADKRYI